MNTQHFSYNLQEALPKSMSIAQENNNPTVEIIHLFKGAYLVNPELTKYILDISPTDEQNFLNEIDKEITRLPVSNGGAPYFTKDIQEVILLSQKHQKNMGDEYLTLEHIILTFVDQGKLLKDYFIEKNITTDTTKQRIMELRGNKKANSPNAESGYQSLKKYTRDLNELAKEGKIDPVIGRQDEIRRVLQIISRRTKNNPILLGEPGVGKTAIAEGLAQRIIEGDVPESIKSKKIMALDLGLLTAGAKFQGEFEERLKNVIREVVDSNGEIILFIDEIHGLVGTGANREGSMDAANLLKPDLARGTLRVIGATTYAEYQKYIEKDKALERRFQPVPIKEPDIDSAVAILRGIKEKYELHHGVRIKDEAVMSAVKMSARYISNRYLPDKAIDTMDEAAAKLRIDIDSLPEDLDKLQRKITQLEVEKEAHKNEGDKDREKKINKQIADLNEEHSTLRAKWEKEKKIITEIKNIKSNIERYKHEAEQAERKFDYGKVAELRYGKITEAEKKLKDLNAQADTLKKANPLLKEEVDSEDIAQVIAKWTGIPTSKLLKEEKGKLLNIEKELEERIAGQSHAIRVVADAIRRSRTGLSDPNRPIGSFLFLGTTGVGKTELCKALAENLYEDKHALIRIDMSEYQEKHSVSRLIGSPPGYVGYDEGGQLTEAVRKKQYSVILLDEIEKAHPDIFHTMLQVLDDGRLTDGKGRIVDFKNTIIIMTTNLGTDIIQQELREGTNDSKALEKTKDKIFKLLQTYLRPEFINRIDEIVMFNPLSKEIIEKIARIQLDEVTRRIAQQKIKIKFDKSVIQKISTEGYNLEFGARPMKRLIQREIIDRISTLILKGEIIKNQTYSSIVDNKEIVFKKN